MRTLGGVTAGGKCAKGGGTCDMCADLTEISALRGDFSSRRGRQALKLIEKALKRGFVREARRNFVDIAQFGRFFRLV